MTLHKKDLFRLYLAYFSLIIIINIVSAISISFLDGLLALIIGVIWVVVTIIFYFIVRKNRIGLILYSFCNAIVSGIAISAYYSLEDVLQFNPLLFLIAFGVVMLISYKVVSKVKNYNLFIRVNIGVSILLLIFSTIIWIGKSHTIGSSLVFFCIIYLCFNIALLRVNKKDINSFMILGYASFIMFGGILVIVILALFEDGIELLLTGVGDGVDQRRDKF